MAMRHPDALARRAGAPPDGSPPTGVVGGAWTVTVLLSAVPAIAADLVAGFVPGWLVFAQIGVAAALLGAALWPPVRVLWRFAVVMGVMPLLILLAGMVSWEWMPAQALLGSTAFDARMQAEQTGKLVVALAMIGMLLLMGLRRRDFFLAVGDLRAPIRPVRTLGFPRAEPWWKFGLIWGFGIAAALAAVQWLVLRPSGAEFAAIVPMIPSILVYAALNAFSEEMTYRAPMLATLGPAVGARSALAMSAVFFGVAHFFGVPGGLVGAALSIFLGWILGKAMLETRGLFWAWVIHFLCDVAIFVFLAVQLVG